jgi:acyl-CoA thioesterase-2
VPHSAGSIRAALDLTRVDADAFVGRHAAGTTLSKTYGGQLLAQATAAATRTVAEVRELHSLTAWFLAAGTTGHAIRYEVERVRDGRTFTGRSVIARQGETELLRLFASFHVPEPGLQHAVTAPEAPGPESVPPLHEVMSRRSALPSAPWQREWAGLEVRYVPDHLRLDGEAPSRQQFWVRLRDRLPDDPTLHRQVITYLSDHMLLAAALVSHGFMLGDPELPRASLNHAIWFHSHARADEWLLVDQRSPWAGSALGYSAATVHTIDGQLVASVGQEGLIRPVGELRRKLGFS